MLGDIRYALRTFARRPSFAIAAIVILALGIAVNTIAFSLVNSLALRPLPVPDAGRVVRIYPVDERGRRGNLFAYPDVADIRAQASEVLETLAAYVPVEITAGRASLDRGVVTPRPALAYVVSSSYFDVTRVRPALGRILQRSDDGPGARSVVISDAFWQRRFNGERAAIGATIRLNAEPFTVVGVVAPGFAGTEPLAADLWIPVSAIRVTERADFADRDSASFLVLGRLRAGVTADRANRVLAVIVPRLAAAYPGKSRPRSTEVAAGTFFPLESGLKPVIAGALAVVGLVLLIACGNVANLMLARAISRQREIAVRLAIGASRSRIVRQLVVEALLLSLAAGVLGLLLSTWTLRLLYIKALTLNPFWWTVSLTLAPDVRVFAYTLGIAATAGLVFGLVPALQAASPGVIGALNDSHTVAGARVGGARVRHGLVVLQVAGSLVLLMAAGLLARGLRSAEALDLGFSTHDVVYAEFNLRAQEYSAARAAAFNAALLERLSTVGGVVDAAVTSHVPLHGGVRRITMRLANASTAEPVSVTVTKVSATYFDVLRIGFIAGRNLEGVDRGERPIVISEGLARRFWPGQPAIGKTMTSDAWPAPRTIVGVVRDAATTAIWREKQLAVYMPLDEADPRDAIAALVRTTGDPSAVRAAVEATGAALDPDLRFTVMPVDTLLQLWLLPSRVAAAAAGVLALIAILLASFGLYAVLSFAVSHRLREIGIRMALGATSRDVVSLVLTDAWRVLAAGLAIGALSAAATAPFLGRLLYGVSAFDPLTIAVVTLVLVAAALVASYVPARRATRLEPLVVLRMD